MGCSAYATVKYGERYSTNSGLVAARFAGFAQGITLNAVAPGFIANTGFTGAWSKERVRGIIEQTPVGRGGHVDDVAAAVHYLSSPEAYFVTGEVLNVNGGWLFGH